MGDSIRRFANWLWEKRAEIFLQAILIPFVTWLMNEIASLFINSEILRAIIFCVVVACLIAGGCFTLAWIDRRKWNIADDRRLAILRIAHEGEKLLKEFNAQGGEDKKHSIGPELAQWYDKTLKIINESFGDVSSHFADMGKYAFKGGSLQAEELISRLHDIANHQSASHTASPAP
jgi:hypothetical protein